jgi:tripartite-type tricarboxylate transporter receptor subunit TctC
MFPTVLRTIARFASCLAPLSLGLGAVDAAAQNFPSGPITIKVGYSAGGPADAATRELQGALQAALRQPVIIENQPGAGGSLAALGALKAAPDGHTLLVLTGNDLILGPLLFASAHYKMEEFTLVHPLIFSEFVLVTGHDAAPPDFDTLVRDARSSPREYSFGNWGVGSMPHLIAGDFRNQTGVKTLDVPYKGAAPIAADLIGKQIDYAFLPLAGATQSMIDSGKLRAVGLASKTRSANLPQVKAAGESQSLRDFDYMVWPGLFVHSATPRPIVERLNAIIGGVVNSAPYQKWSRETGNRPMVLMNLTQAAEFYASEQGRSRRLAAALKLTPQ